MNVLHYFAYNMDNLSNYIFNRAYSILLHPGSIPHVGQDVGKMAFFQRRMLFYYQRYYRHQLSGSPFKKQFSNINCQLFWFRYGRWYLLSQCSACLIICCDKCWGIFVDRAYLGYYCHKMLLDWESFVAFICTVHSF